MKKTKMTTLGMTILSVIAVAVLLWAVGSVRASPPMRPPAQGGAPLLLNYQGRLADPTTGLAKPDGTYNITFQIYDAQTYGTLIWSETQEVTVTRGLFNVLLGSSTALEASHFSGTSRWLELAVDGETLSPRVRIVSAPYAIQAEEARNADTLDGSHASAFASANHNHAGEDITSGTVANARIDANIARDAEIIPTVLANDGPGSGLNADLLDNRDSSHFAEKLHSHCNETWSCSGAALSLVGGSMGLSASGSSYGINASSSDTAVYGSGSDIGVFGNSSSGTGVKGSSTSGTGVWAYSQDYTGVRAYSTNSYAIYADTTNGVYGLYTPDKIFVGGGCVNCDIAEAWETTADVSTGDVVVIDRDNGVLTRSVKPYDTAVAGVISSEPALLIGRSESRTALALAGRVRCKGSAENGSIRPGDLLTTSSTPGHAMKARSSPPAGTIVGKALEGLDEGTGVIMVLVMLQ